MGKKNFLILSLKIFITVLLFFYVNKTVNFSEFGQINNVGLIFFIAVSFGFLQQFFLLCRWYFSLKTLKISCGKKSAVKSYFIGQFLGTISPARSGDLAKIFYLENTTKRRGIYAIILDGSVAMLTLFIVGLWKNYPQNSEETVLIIDKILSAAGILGILIISIIVTFIFFSRKIEPKRDVLENFAKSLSFSLLQNVALVIQGALIFSVLLPVSLTQASFAAASAYCIMPLIPLTIASIGVREFSFSLFVSAFVFDQNVKPAIFAASYILLLCNSVIFMIPGIILFYKSGK